MPPLTCHTSAPPPTFLRGAVVTWCGKEHTANTLGVMAITLGLLLLVAFWPLGNAQDSCQFSLPVYGSQGQCANFDLSELARMSPFNVSSNGTIGYTNSTTYLLNLCGKVTIDDTPIVCYDKRSAKPAAAYQFNTASNCYVIGRLDDVLVVRSNVFQVYLNRSTATFIQLKQKIVVIEFKGSPFIMNNITLQSNKFCNLIGQPEDV